MPGLGNRCRVLVAGLGDDTQKLKDMSKRTDLECRIVVPGTRHHAVVLCQPSSRKLHPGQQLIDPNRQSAMPVGVYMPGSYNNTWPGYKSLTARGSGAASMVVQGGPARIQKFHLNGRGDLPSPH